MNVPQQSLVFGLEILARQPILSCCGGKTEAADIIWNGSQQLAI